METNAPSGDAPRKKRDYLGSSNPMMPLVESEFKDVPAPAGFDRIDNGKVSFGKGNNLAQIGHMNKRKKRAYWQELVEKTVTPEDFKAIVAKCVEQAKAGNAEARAEIFNRLAGKVTDKIEIELDETGGDKWTWIIKRHSDAPSPTVIETTAREPSQGEGTFPKLPEPTPPTDDECQKSD